MTKTQRGRVTSLKVTRQAENILSLRWCKQTDINLLWRPAITQHYTDIWRSLSYSTTSMGKILYLLSQIIESYYFLRDRSRLGTGVECFMLLLHWFTVTVFESLKLYYFISSSKSKFVQKWTLKGNSLLMKHMKSIYGFVFMTFLQKNSLIHSWPSRDKT